MASVFFVPERMLSDTSPWRCCKVPHVSCFFKGHSRYSVFNQRHRWFGRRRGIHGFVRVIALKAGEVMEMTSIHSHLKFSDTRCAYEWSHGERINCCVPFLITKLDHQSKSLFET